MSDPSPVDERYVVPGLHKGIQMLECFGRQQPRWTLSELAAALSLPISTAFRVAYTLEQAGLLVRDSSASKHYRLGMKVLDLGYKYLTSIDLVQVATPHLERLREKTGGSVQMAIRDGTDVVYLIRLPGLGKHNPDIFVGSRLPAHATAPGRVLLADMQSDELDKLYDGVVLTKLMERTVTSVPALKTMLKRDRSKGYVLSIGSCYIPGLSSMATGVRGMSGRIEASISVSAPEAVIPNDLWESRFKTLLLGTAELISQSLGYRATA